MFNIRKFWKNNQEIYFYEKEEWITLSEKMKKMYLHMDSLIFLEEDSIQDLEELIWYNIPEDYKNFLKKNNGWYPDKNIFWDGKVVNFFLWFFYNKKIQLSIEFYLQTYGWRIPEGTLTIASAWWRDLILIWLDSEKYGKIYYWSWEKEDLEEYYWENIWENLEFISDSFSNFLKMLY